MKKFIFLIISCFLFILNGYGEQTDYSYFHDEFQLPNITAKNILLYNLNDEEMVYEQKSEEKIAIASLTKIMTAVVALEKISDLNELVEIPKEAFLNLEGYALAGFKENEQVTYRDLLYGMLLPSGAEAAQALALLTYHDYASFVKKMNEKAVSLGMTNTKYNNPIGKDNTDNYSTLQDLLKLLKYALKNDEFYKAYTTRYYETIQHLELESTFASFLLQYHVSNEYIKGTKSGFTSKAGLCLSSIAIKDGIQYLLITAGSDYQNNQPNHVLDSLNLYDYFFTHFGNYSILEQNQVLATIPVEDSKLKEYEIKSNRDVSMYLKDTIKDALVYEYQGLEKLNKKIKPNTKLGVVFVKYKNQTLYTLDVYLQEKISYNYTKEIVLIAILFFNLFLFIKILMKKKLKREVRKC